MHYDGARWAKGYHLFLVLKFLKLFPSNLKVSPTSMNDLALHNLYMAKISSQLS